MTSHIDIVRANFARRSTIQGELRQIDEAATTDHRDYSDTEAARITELRSELEAVDGRISANLAIEERSADLSRGVESLLGAVMDRSGEVTDTRSLGEQFVGLDEFRAWADAGARGASPALTTGMDLRAVTDTTTGSTSGGAWINNQRLGRVGYDNLDRRVFLMDLLPSIAVSTGAVEYVQDKSPLADLANKAAEVTEGSAKPQAGITTEVVTEATATIAAWANMTRQVVADAPQVQGYIDGRLRYALKRRTDSQVINGNGTAPNLRGLANRSGILTYAPAAAEARYLSIRRAVRLMEDAESVPEIIVLNPADAEIFDVSNHASNGLNAVPNVAGPSARTAWGLTQVRSTAIASGTALLVDPMALAVLDRQQVSAYLTDSHASNFTSNILTLLLEARVGLALFDPAGVAKVTFNGTI
jgi:HK97 family phage major capsid protein